MLGMGFAQNWTTLVALRAILGVFESALFPGAAYLISCWYPRKEMATRNVVFYISAAVGGSFGKPLGYAFSLLHRKGGRSGWQWVFIIYGIITIFIAIAGYFFIVDFPDKATFINQEERDIIALRIERDRADSKPDPLTGEKLKKYLLLGQPWLFSFFFMANATASYAMAYFLPTILQGMGFTNIESMMLGTPMYFWALIPALGCARLSDRLNGTRGFSVAINSFSVVLGTAMFSQIPVSQKAARFVGIFIAVGGAQANTPLIISWMHTAIRAQSKRGYTSALIVAAGGAGGILGSTIFMNKEGEFRKPHEAVLTFQAKQGFPTGIYITLALNAVSTVGVLSLVAYFHRQNRRADKGEIVIEGHEDFRYQP
jgi:sugar phosphate permease